MEKKSNDFWNEIRTYGAISCAFSRCTFAAIAWHPEEITACIKCHQKLQTRSPQRNCRVMQAAIKK